jgi:hypothetical protein
MVAFDCVALATQEVSGSTGLGLRQAYVIRRASTRKQALEQIDYEKAKTGPGFNLLLEK